MASIRSVIHSTNDATARSVLVANLREILGVVRAREEGENGDFISVDMLEEAVRRQQREAQHKARIDALAQHEREMQLQAHLRAVEQQREDDVTFGLHTGADGGGGGFGLDGGGSAADRRGAGGGGEGDGDVTVIASMPLLDVQAFGGDDGTASFNSSARSSRRGSLSGSAARSSSFTEGSEGGGSAISTPRSGTLVQRAQAFQQQRSQRASVATTSAPLAGDPAAPVGGGTSYAATDAEAVERWRQEATAVAASFAFAIETAAKEVTPRKALRGSMLTPQDPSSLPHRRGTHVHGGEATSSLSIAAEKRRLRAMRSQHRPTSASTSSVSAEEDVDDPDARAPPPQPSPGPTDLSPLSVTSPNRPNSASATLRPRRPLDSTALISMTDYPGGHSITSGPRGWNASRTGTDGSGGAPRVRFSVGQLPVRGDAPAPRSPPVTGNTLGDRAAARAVRIMKALAEDDILAEQERQTALQRWVVEEDARLWGRRSSRVPRHGAMGGATKDSHPADTPNSVKGGATTATTSTDHTGGTGLLRSDDDDDSSVRSGDDDKASSASSEDPELFEERFRTFMELAAAGDTSWTRDYLQFGWLERHQQLEKAQQAARVAREKSAAAEKSADVALALSSTGGNAATRGGPQPQRRRSVLLPQQPPPRPQQEEQQSPPHHHRLQEEDDAGMLADSMSMHQMHREGVCGSSMQLEGLDPFNFGEAKPIPSSVSSAGGSETKKTSTGSVSGPPSSTLRRRPSAVALAMQRVENISKEIASATSPGSRGSAFGTALLSGTSARPSGEAGAATRMVVSLVEGAVDRRDEQQGETMNTNGKPPATTRKKNASVTWGGPSPTSTAAAGAGADATPIPTTVDFTRWRRQYVDVSTNSGAVPYTMLDTVASSRWIDKVVGIEPLHSTTTTTTSTATDAPTKGTTTGRNGTRGSAKRATGPITLFAGSVLRPSAGAATADIDGAEESTTASSLHLPRSGDRLNQDHTAAAGAAGVGGEAHLTDTEERILRGVAPHLFGGRPRACPHCNLPGLVDGPTRHVVAPAVVYRTLQEQKHVLSGAANATHQEARLQRERSQRRRQSQSNSRHQQVPPSRGAGTGRSVVDESGPLSLPTAIDREVIDVDSVVSSSAVSAAGDSRPPSQTSSSSSATHNSRSGSEDDEGDEDSGEKGGGPDWSVFRLSRAHSMARRRLSSEAEAEADRLQALEKAAADVDGDTVRGINKSTRLYSGPQEEGVDALLPPEVPRSLLKTLDAAMWSLVGLNLKRRALGQSNLAPPCLDSRFVSVTKRSVLQELAAHVIHQPKSTNKADGGHDQRPRSPATRRLLAFDVGVGLGRLLSRAPFVHAQLDALQSELLGLGGYHQKHTATDTSSGLKRRRPRQVLSFVGSRHRRSSAFSSGASPPPNVLTSASHSANPATAPSLFSAALHLGQLTADQLAEISPQYHFALEAAAATTAKLSAGGVGGVGAVVAALFNPQSTVARRPTRASRRLTTIDSAFIDERDDDRSSAGASTPSASAGSPFASEAAASAADPPATEALNDDVLRAFFLQALKRPEWAAVMGNLSTAHARVRLIHEGNHTKLAKRLQQTQNEYKSLAAMYESLEKSAETYVRGDVLLDILDHESHLRDRNRQLAQLDLDVIAQEQWYKSVCRELARVGWVCRQTLAVRQELQSIVHGLREALHDEAAYWSTVPKRRFDPWDDVSEETRYLINHRDRLIREGLKVIDSRAYAEILVEPATFDDRQKRTDAFLVRLEKAMMAEANENSNNRSFSQIGHSSINNNSSSSIAPASAVIPPPAGSSTSSGKQQEGKDALLPRTVSGGLAGPKTTPTTTAATATTSQPLVRSESALSTATSASSGQHPSPPNLSAKAILDRFSHVVSGGSGSSPLVHQLQLDDRLSRDLRFLSLPGGSHDLAPPNTTLPPTTEMKNNPTPATAATPNAAATASSPLAKKPSTLARRVFGDTARKRLQGVTGEGEESGPTADDAALSTKAKLIEVDQRLEAALHKARQAMLAATGDASPDGTAAQAVDPLSRADVAFIQEYFGNVCPDCDQLVGASPFCPLTGQRHEAMRAEIDASPVTEADSAAARRRASQAQRLTPRVSSRGLTSVLTVSGEAEGRDSTPTLTAAGGADAAPPTTTDEAEQALLPPPKLLFLDAILAVPRDSGVALLNNPAAGASRRSPSNSPPSMAASASASGPASRGNDNDSIAGSLPPPLLKERLSPSGQRGGGPPAPTAPTSPFHQQTLLVDLSHTSSAFSAPRASFLSVASDNDTEVSHFRQTAGGRHNSPRPSRAMSFDASFFGVEGTEGLVLPQQGGGGNAAHAPRRRSLQSHRRLSTSQGADSADDSAFANEVYSFILEGVLGTVMGPESPPQHVREVFTIAIYPAPPPGTPPASASGSASGGCERDGAAAGDDSTNAHKAISAQARRGSRVRILGVGDTEATAPGDEDRTSPREPSSGPTAAAENSGGTVSSSGSESDDEQSPDEDNIKGGEVREGGGGGSQPNDSGDGNMASSSSPDVKKRIRRKKSNRKKSSPSPSRRGTSSRGRSRSVSHVSENPNGSDAATDSGSPHTITRGKTFSTSDPKRATSTTATAATNAPTSRAAQRARVSSGTHVATAILERRQSAVINRRMLQELFAADDTVASNRGPTTGNDGCGDTLAAEESTALPGGNTRRSADALMVPNNQQRQPPPTASGNPPTIDGPSVPHRQPQPPQGPRRGTEHAAGLPRANSTHRRQSSVNRPPADTVFVIRSPHSGALKLVGGSGGGGIALDGAKPVSPSEASGGKGSGGGALALEEAALAAEERLVRCLNERVAKRVDRRQQLTTALFATIPMVEAEASVGIPAAVAQATMAAVAAAAGDSETASIAIVPPSRDASVGRYASSSGGAVLGGSTTNPLHSSKGPNPLGTRPILVPPRVPSLSEASVPDDTPKNDAASAFMRSLMRVKHSPGGDDVRRDGAVSPPPNPPPQRSPNEVSFVPTAAAGASASPPAEPPAALFASGMAASTTSTTPKSKFGGILNVLKAAKAFKKRLSVSRDAREVIPPTQALVGQLLGLRQHVPVGFGRLVGDRDAHNIIAMLTNELGETMKNPLRSDCPSGYTSMARKYAKTMRRCRKRNIAAAGHSAVAAALITHNATHHIAAQQHASLVANAAMRRTGTRSYAASVSVAEPSTGFSRSLSHQQLQGGPRGHVGGAGLPSPATHSSLGNTFSGGGGALGGTIGTAAMSGPSLGPAAGPAAGGGADPLTAATAGGYSVLDADLVIQLGAVGGMRARKLYRGLYVPTDKAYEQLCVEAISEELHIIQRDAKRYFEYVAKSGSIARRGGRAGTGGTGRGPEGGGTEVTRFLHGTSSAPRRRSHRTNAFEALAAVPDVDSGNIFSSTRRGDLFLTAHQHQAHGSQHKHPHQTTLLVKQLSNMAGASTASGSSGTPSMTPRPAAKAASSYNLTRTLTGLTGLGLTGAGSQPVHLTSEQQRTFNALQEQSRLERDIRSYRSILDLARHPVRVLLQRAMDLEREHEDLTERLNAACTQLEREAAEATATANAEGRRRGSTAFDLSSYSSMGPGGFGATAVIKRTASGGVILPISSSVTAPTEATLRRTQSVGRDGSERVTGGARYSVVGNGGAFSPVDTHRRQSSIRNPHPSGRRFTTHDTDGFSSPVPRRVSSNVSSEPPQGEGGPSRSVSPPPPLTVFGRRPSEARSAAAGQPSTLENTMARHNSLQRFSSRRGSGYMMAAPSELDSNTKGGISSDRNPPQLVFVETRAMIHPFQGVAGPGSLAVSKPSHGDEEGNGIEALENALLASSGSSSSSSSSLPSQRPAAVSSPQRSAAPAAASPASRTSPKRASPKTSPPSGPLSPRGAAIEPKVFVPGALFAHATGGAAGPLSACLPLGSSRSGPMMVLHDHPLLISASSSGSPVAALLSPVEPALRPRSPPMVYHRSGAQTPPTSPTGSVRSRSPGHSISEMSALSVRSGGGSHLPYASGPSAIRHMPMPPSLRHGTTIAAISAPSHTLRVEGAAASAVGSYTPPSSSPRRQGQVPPLASAHTTPPSSAATPSVTRHTPSSHPTAAVARHLPLSSARFAPANTDPTGLPLVVASAITPPAPPAIGPAPVITLLSGARVHPKTTIASPRPLATVPPPPAAAIGQTETTTAPMAAKIPATSFSASGAFAGGAAAIGATSVVTPHRSTDPRAAKIDHSGDLTLSLKNTSSNKNHQPPRSQSNDKTLQEQQQQRSLRASISNAPTLLPSSVGPAIKTTSSSEKGPSSARAPPRTKLFTFNLV